MSVRNTRQFIEKASKLHRNKYDYSEAHYSGHCRKLKIICPIHGEFWQAPNVHLRPSGCPRCSCKSALGKDEFIARSRAKHGDTYDYSLVEYKNTKTKVRIVCKEHGEFSISPHSHMRGAGCPRCRESR